WGGDQVARFLQATVTDPRYPVWHLALMSGLRRSELAGLAWEAVELDAGSLRVVQTLTQVGGTLHVGPPKTTRGKRVVDLDPSTIAVLKAHRVRQAQEAMAHGRPVPTLVFDGVHPDTLTKEWE